MTKTRRRFRFGLKAKIILAFSSISLALVILAAVFSYRQEKAAFMDGLERSLITASYAVEGMLPDDYHERIEAADSVPAEDYAGFIETFNKVAEPLGLEYVYSYMKFGDEIVTTSSSFPQEDLDYANQAAEFLKHGERSAVPPEEWEKAVAFLNEWYGEGYVPEDEWEALEKIRNSIEFFYVYDTPSENLKLAFESEIGEPIFDFYDDPEYGHVLSCFIPLETESGKRYVIGADVEYSYIVNKWRQTFWTIIGAAAIFILLFLGATFFTVKSISNPIDSLLGTARDISEKADYGLRAEKVSHDELGELVDGFNEMLDEIQRRRQELSQHRDNLETEIEKRTAELVDLNRDLETAKQQAEEASEAKSSFLANMTHELRTPLNAVIGYSEMLEEEAEDLGQEAFIPDLKRIKGAGKHLLGLISNILDLSKIEAGKMAVFPEWVELEELIRDVSATIQPLVDKSKNELIVDTQGDLGKAYTDQTKVRQLLFNLLSNAAKFTEDGKVSIKVRREPEGDGKDSIRMVVSDTGIGMSREQIDKLFTPFTQADDSTSRKYGGTGLGLAITREFCHMLGGEINLESEIGKGSTFTIVVPAVYEREESPGPEDAGGKKGGEGTLLVTDDEEADREMMN